MQDTPEITIAQASVAGKKACNDDSYGVLVPEGSLLSCKGIAMAIADGMSSSEAAKEASETCIKSFLSDYYDTPDSWTVQTAVGRVLSATNRWLQAQSNSRFNSDTGMASTFSGAILKGGKLHIFHVGDSRIALVRDGSLQSLTRAHQSRDADGRYLLSRAMGADLHLDVDVQSLAAETGDILMFSTDGFHEHVKDQEILAAIQESASLQDACEGLVTRALAAGSPDNVTCQLVHINNLGAKDKDARLYSIANLPFPPDLQADQKIGGYRIVRELHASPRSQVYLATDELSGQKVALKTPSDNFNDDPMYLEFFAREEWVGQTISNAHVARSIDPSQPRQFLYTVLEYVEGQTLGQWINDRELPKPAEVRGIIEQVVTGLRAFHRKEIIHQDLKPDNIMIDNDGTVKIVDFGSVRVLGIEEADIGHVPEHALGTAAYSAPELILGHKAKRASDLYSLATITYEMLTGRLPYKKALTNKRAIDRARYQPAHLINPNVPAWLDGALETALSIDPAARQTTLSEFLSDLKVPKERYKKEGKPLMQRDPLLFWKGLSALLAALLLVSLYF